MNYWWLNINPKIIRFREIEVGEIFEYSSLNEDGSERKFIKDKEYRCVERSNGNMVLMDENKLGVELAYPDFICNFEPIVG